MKTALQWDLEDRFVEIRKPNDWMIHDDPNHYFTELITKKEYLRRRDNSLCHLYGDAQRDKRTGFELTADRLAEYKNVEFPSASQIRTEWMKNSLLMILLRREIFTKMNEQITNSSNFRVECTFTKSHILKDYLNIIQEDLKEKGYDVDITNESADFRMKITF